MDKLLYTVGNLFTGYPYGVEAEQSFGTVDVYGPFNSENAANTFAHRLIEDHAVTGRYVGVKVVKIETPQAGKHIVREADGKWAYAS